MSTVKRKALGRGLAALIPGAAPSHPSVLPAGDGARTVGGGGLELIAIEEVHPARAQPRKLFDETRIEELAASIRTQGVIQPLVVRKRESGGYELIAGERRWRAAQRAGLHAVPAVIRDVAPTRAFEMAMVENLQREDLNPIEEAAGYQRLISELGYTQESLAARVGKDRTTITNALRLLRLPEEVRDLVVAGRVSMGHARALLGLESNDTIVRLARRVAAREMSVRQVEGLVRREREGNGDNATSAPAARPSASARDLAERLSRVLGARVKVIESGADRGHLEIHYHSLDELDGLIGRLLPS
ncbi:MAG TPA: ParB/RepB/Spo0J family partition protein [Polyangia bacterium]|jgi:ParB family chromosome partitioning protein|nr:ParB/RepB/Spo0J family partition protein [Polyangia bacterium]